MKIVDLIIKIANKEEVPYKIKYNGNIYEFDGETQNYLSPVNLGMDFLIGEDIVCLLNDEVEIIEESKKVEMPKHLSDDFTGLKWYADGSCFAYADCSDKLELKQDVICADNPKKVEMPKHIPDAVIQDLNRTVYPGDVKCIAHKVNEIINYLQYKEKREKQED